MNVLALCALALLQGNPCEYDQDLGDGGCAGVSHLVTHSSILSGVELTGTDYEGKCAVGVGGCTVNQPMMRFWRQDSFDEFNSAVAVQQLWMLNWMLDLGAGTNTGLWAFHLADWDQPLVQGCIPVTERTVAELSFCDSVSSEAMYVIGSVPAQEETFDFVQIQGGVGPLGAVMLSLPVPVPVVPTTGVMDTPVPGFGTFSVDIEDGLFWYTENGLNDPLHPLIAGYEILYNVASSLTPGCETGLGAWRPVLDPLTASGPLGVVQPGRGIRVTTPMNGPGEMVYVASRVVYSDFVAGCVPGDCLDPETQGAPAACFLHFAGPVNISETQVCPVTDEVQDLRAVKIAGTQRVRLTWEPVIHPCHVSYRVYRTQTSGMRPAVPPGVWPNDPSFRDVTAMDLDVSAVNTSYTWIETRPWRALLVASEGTDGVVGPIEHFGR